MKIKTQLVFGVLAGMGVLSSLLPQAILAQSTLTPPGEVKPSDTFQNEQNTDPFSRSDNGSSFGVLDLIHRATLGNTRDLNEYSIEQRQNINTAADEFRRLQLERLRNQNQASPNNQTNPVTNTPTQN